METKQVNLEEFKQLLSEVNTQTEGKITTYTELKMNKKDNPYYGKIFKLSTYDVLMKFNYAQAVNEQLIKEGKEPDFVSKPRAWGVHIKDTPLLEHKGEFYLEVRCINDDSADIKYFMDEKEIDEKTFEQYAPAKKESSLETGTKITMRDIKLKNIKKLQFNNTEYVISNID